MPSLRTTILSALAYRTQPVSDHDDGAALHQEPQRFDDEAFRTLYRAAAVGSSRIIMGLLRMTARAMPIRLSLAAR